MSHPGRLASKFAIITGGSSGIGAAIVKKFVQEGAKVLAFDLRKPTEDDVLFCEGDVTKFEDWEKAVGTCMERFGRVDVCVNNAGVVHVAKKSHEVEVEEYERIMRVNVQPLYHSAKALHEVFKKQGGGVFVNTSSMSAPRPRPKLVWYAGSKGAVSTITKGLAAEYARDNIRVNCVCPTLVDTAMVPDVLGGEDTPEGREKLVKGIPLGRMGRGEDVASAI